MLLLAARGPRRCACWRSAFARPFLREAGPARTSARSTQRRIAVLIDTSASMRRGDLWPQAKALAGEVHRRVPAGRSTGRVRLRRDVAGRCSASANRRRSIRRGGRRSPGRGSIAWRRPGARPNLGQALVDAVAAIEDVADTSEKAGRMPRRIVLISDLQQGSRLDALGDFEWPSDVELDLKTVADDGSNAGLQRLADPAEAEPAGADREPSRPGRQRPRLAPRDSSS